MGGMEHEKIRVRTSYPIDLPFSPDESVRFRSFLKATGRKAGPWMRTLAIRAMDAEEGRGDGSRQAQELAKALRGEGQGESANRLIGETASSEARP
jgi:hypothetical protein